MNFTMRSKVKILLHVLSLPILAAAASGPVKGPLVVSDRWPECTKLTTWVQDVMRLERVENASETTQGKVLFRWLRLFSRMATGGMIQAFEGEYGAEKSVMDAHKQLFVYGWGFCDTTSRLAEAIWDEYKQDPNAAQRVCVQHDNGGFHTMYRLRMDGRYGAFDPRYGYYLIEKDSPDARVLDWDEVGVDENILKNKGYKYRSGPFFEYFGIEWERAFLIKPAFFVSEKEWRNAGSPVECVFANPMYRMRTRYHDMDFQLPKGMTIERYWDNSARKFYIPAGKHTQKEEPFRPSGRFYRVTETMFDGNWPKYDPNYQKCKPYLVTVPVNEGYNKEVSGGRTIGQAWGRLTYYPDLRDPVMPEILTPDSTFVHAASAPFMRAPGKEAAQATFDFYSPYVLVDANLTGELAGTASDDLKLEVRTLQAKTLNESQPDIWSRWQLVHKGPGRFSIPLGREVFNGRDVSVHGTYRFQFRISTGPNRERSAPAGLSALRLVAYFENGIMSIPQIFEGRNTIHFKVRDASLLRGPVTIVYRYRTNKGPAQHRHVLHPHDFRDNVAIYQLRAPGLIRCDSLSISY